MIAPQQEVYRPARARSALNEPTLLQRDDHVVDRRGRHPKVALHVGFSGWDAVDFGVIVDERQVLALRRSVVAFHVGIVDGHGLLVNESVRTVLGLAARSVIGHPVWVRARVRRFINSMEVDLVPRNSQSGALDGVYQFHHIGVSHFKGPFQVLTLSVPEALVPALWETSSSTVMS